MNTTPETPTVILTLIIDDQRHSITVPDTLLTEARSYFDQIDQDLDGGWQMGRDWIASPNRLQRCQIVADRLLTAIETENRKLGTLMAAYLLQRLPGLETVEPDIQGEPHHTRFEIGRPPAAAPISAPSPAPPATSKPLSKLDALAQAGRDVTQVFKVGRGYRFSVFDAETHTWLDAPLAPTEADAARLRQAAFKARYEALLSGHAGEQERGS
ncbi:hypothetical protein SAMN05421644_1369 [Allochromatium warmingii]|uniref:Uncharacterized protein n=1 Tax=Allochromatium warmingii TaxID=61595 RepID=A0A1H3HR41_ALLWA|nr:hypothetical protein SAMN05421644_1369 [Allochromatium warmingii]